MRSVHNLSSEALSSSLNLNSFLTKVTTFE